VINAGFMLLVRAKACVFLVDHLGKPERARLMDLQRKLVKMVKNKLLHGLLKAGVAPTQMMDESNIGQLSYHSTDLPILNIAFSAKVDGGFSSGVTVLAGPSATFKTLLGWYCVKAYLDKYEDALCLFYDNEKGSGLKETITDYGIDINRIVHIDIGTVEQLMWSKGLRHLKRETM
jgi:hypothetical protein